MRYIEKEVDKKKIVLGGYSVTGLDKKENQDSYVIGISENHDLAYILVADGLGSCKLSATGAQSINQIAKTWIEEELPKYKYLSTNVVNIFFKRLVENWNKQFAESNVYDYDTTFHGAFYYKGSLFVGGIGDGMALINIDSRINHDTVSKDYFSNVTNSMCSNDVENKMTYEMILKEEIQEKIVVIIATDGISDDLIPDKKDTLTGYFYSVINSEGVDAMQNELEEWLDNWQTEAHSDDKTLAYMIIEKEV